MKQYHVFIYDGIRAQAQNALLKFHQDYLEIDILYEENDLIYKGLDYIQVQKIKELSDPHILISYAELTKGHHQQFNGVSYSKRHIIIESDDPEVNDLLKDQVSAQQLFLIRWIHHINPVPLMVICLITLALVSGIYLNLYRFVPVYQEEILGQFFLKQMTSQYQVCSDPELQQALEQMLQELQEPTDRYPIKITIFKSDIPNAFAVMGGELGVFSELLKQSKSREEVMGILAHELGHVKHQHSLQNLLRAIGISVLVGVFFGDLGFEGIEKIGEIGSGLLLFKYSRDFEREADEEAVYRLNRRKISTIPLADFMSNLKQDVSIDLSWMSTHPNPQERSMFFRSHNQTPKPTVTSEWDEIKDHCNPSIDLDMIDHQDADEIIPIK